MCRRVMKEKVLRIDRPEGRRVLKFDGPLAEGCGGGFAIGHTFGVRVDRASPRGLWPPDGGRLCRRVVEKGS